MRELKLPMEVMVDDEDVDDVDDEPVDNEDGE